jgi:predicted ATPase
LQALFDWSYDLLTEDERGLLRRLSVFAGGWTLEAAEAIAGDGGEFMEEAATASPTLAFIPSYEVLNLLTQLVNKSMVVVENRAESTRYHLLETVRQYARQKLQQAGESEVLHQRHLNYFLRLAEQAGLEPAESIGWSGWVKWLEIERDNLRAALEWVRAKNATGKYPPEVALRLASVIN